MQEDLEADMQDHVQSQAGLWHHGAATLIPTLAVPVWAVLKGAVCILEATLTQRKNLQPWLYI